MELLQPGLDHRGSRTSSQPVLVFVEGRLSTLLYTDDLDDINNLNS